MSAIPRRSMRFEEQVTTLCAQALAANDGAEVRDILAELRLILHEHIEKLRSGLLAAYSTSIIRPGALEDARQLVRVESVSPAKAQHAGEIPHRTWQQVIHEIARERDYGKVLQLSLELNRFLKHRDRTFGSC